MNLFVNIVLICSLSFIMYMIVRTKNVIKDYSNVLIKSSESLSDENRKIFNKIYPYLRTSGLKEICIEETLQQILDIMLETQDKKKNIEDVLGKDYKKFCDSIIKESSTTVPNRLLNVLRVANMGCFIMIVMSFFGFFSSNGLTITKLETNTTLTNTALFYCVYLILLAYAVCLYINKIAFLNDAVFKISVIAGILLGFTSLVVVIGIIMPLITEYSIVTFSKYFILILNCIMYFVIDKIQE